MVFVNTASLSDYLYCRYLWISEDIALSHQKGVFRVNCIDCLDRTNVVQSAFARHVLTQQLAAVALQGSWITPGSEADLVFNDGELHLKNA